MRGKLSLPRQISKSKRKLKQILEDIFIDNNEYVKTSFSRKYIEARIHEKFPSVIWEKNIYPIFMNGRKKLYESYEGYAGYSEFINVEYTDEREICIRKYNKLMKEMCRNKELPIFLDRDVREYRIIYDLSTYEQIFGDLLSSDVKIVKKRLKMMAKSGARLPSGKDSRDLLRDTIKPLKEIEYKKERKENKKYEKEFD